MGKERFVFYFHRNQELIMLCGFYSIYGDSQYTYTLLTMDTTQLINLKPFASVHDRMPVPLWQKEDIDMWLDSTLSWEKVRHLVGRSGERILGVNDLKSDRKVNLRESDELSFEILIRPISNLVSSIRNDSPDCIKAERHSPVKKDQKITSFFKRKSTVEDSEDLQAASKKEKK